MVSVFAAVATIILSASDLTPKVGITAVIAGLVAAVLARVFYKVGVFLLGGMLGCVLSIFAVSFLPSAAVQYGWIVILLLTLIGGVCAVKWCDFFIMASTSFNGAFAIAAPICFLLVEFGNLQNYIYADGAFATMTNLNQYINNEFSTENGILVFLVTLIIAVCGFYFQFTRDSRK